MPIPADRSLAGFFDSLSSPYYVYAPDHRHSSAGIRALHYLCHALNEMGEEAYVYPAKVTNPHLRTPKLTADIFATHFATGRIPVVVYPEVVSGNPLLGPIVARWLLNQPGHLGGDRTFPSTERIFYYDPWIMVGRDDIRAECQLKVPLVDARIFNNEDNGNDDRRSGSCYYANKYLAAGGLVDEHIRRHSTSLCHDTPRSPEDIAAILRKSEVLYCYEQTALMSESLLCGCPVVIMPTDYWVKSQIPGGFLPLGVGLASEPRVLERLTQEVKHARAQQEEFHGPCWDYVAKFVEIMAGAGQKYMQDEASRDSLDPGAIWRVPAQQREKYLPAFEKLYSEVLVALAESRPSTARNSSPSRREISVPPPTGLLPGDLALFEARIATWEAHPLFHLIIVDDGVPDATLSATLQSLLKQNYNRVIATLISNRPAPGDLGEGRLVWWQAEGDPWGLVNEAIAQSPGDWCGTMRAGDTLERHAFLLFGEFLNSHPSYNAVYCDEDTAPSAPRLKPDFDIDLLRATGYVGGLLMARRSLWQTAGGWRPLPRGLDELDAALRLAEVCGAEGLGHVPGLLYRRDGSDPALGPDDADRQMQRCQVVQAHLTRMGINAVAENGLEVGQIRVRYALEHVPKVSVIIPTRDRAARLEACLTSLTDPTEYPDLEIVIIDNGSTEAAARAYLDGLASLGDPRILVLSQPGDFNLAALTNLGVQHAKGELVLLLHDDIVALHRDWLVNMVTLCLRPEAASGVGAVGARLLKPDGTLQQAWLDPIRAGIVDPPFQGWPLDAPATRLTLAAEHQATAVNGACLLLRRQTFLDIGGMDAERFPVKFADIDFCLKLRNGGHKIIWTPYATLIHDGDNSTWGDRDTNCALFGKWGKAVVEDPCFNPYLSVGSDKFEPEAEPVFIPDTITWHPLPSVYAMPSDSDGAGHYRVMQPVQGAAAENLIRGRIAHGYPFPALMDKLEIDVVYSQRQLDDQQLRNLTRFRELLGCRIIMDTDDLVTHVPEKNVHKKTVFKDMKSRMRQLAAIAHRFTVSTEPIAEEFRQYHDDIVVVPNALMRSQWAHLKSERRTSRKMRVGWAGGVSHQGDLEIIRDVVRELSGEVDWVFMGMCIDELKGHVREFHPGVPFAAYPAKLASLNLDLAIAPLEMNRFNECKSHLRLLEYGILGIPVVATDIFPYSSGFPVTLVKNKHKDWVRAIRDHVNDAEETYRRGDKLRQYILDRWMLDQHLPSWLAAWTS